MTTFLLYYLLGILALFVSLIGILEYMRRRSIEEIRASSANVFLNYYGMKIEDFCRNKDESCREKLSQLVVKELSRQVEEDKIQYIDIEKLYEETDKHSSN